MVITLRPATTTDLAGSNTLIGAAIMSWDLSERVIRLTLPSYQYNAHDLQHMQVMVADTGQWIVGVAAWEMQQMEIDGHSQPVLSLHGVYVDPAQHRRGIGRQLFAAAVQAARATGQVGLLVKAQRGSEGFYLAMGMRPLAVADARRDFASRYFLAL